MWGNDPFRAEPRGSITGSSSVPAIIEHLQASPDELPVFNIHSL